MILVSPTEPQIIRDQGKTSSLPEQYGADVLIVDRHQTIGLQRKQFPDDFVSSLFGDRMARLLPLLTKCSSAWLILEGVPAWTADGTLVGYDYGSISRRQLRGVLWSAREVFGVAHMWTGSVDDTALMVGELAAWAAKGSHDSLLGRPAAPKNARGVTSERAKALWLLQSVEGVGPKLAADILDHFGRVPLRWDVSDSELLEVPGLGPKRLEALRKALTPKLE